MRHLRPRGHAFSPAADAAGSRVVDSYLSALGLLEAELGGAAAFDAVVVTRFDVR